MLQNVDSLEKQLIWRGALREIYQLALEKYDGCHVEAIELIMEDFIYPLVLDDYDTIRDILSQEIAKLEAA